MNKDILYDGRFLKIKSVPFDDKNYEVCTMGDAVAVLLLNEDYTKMLIVKQKRPVVDGLTYEIPAGMCDIEGEDKKTTMVRELKEEANVKIKEEDLVELTSYYPIIGSVKHFITLYGATTKETDNQGIENDDVEAMEWISIEDIRDLINEGKICDGKTILAYNYYERMIDNKRLKMLYSQLKNNNLKIEELYEKAKKIFDYSDI